MQGTELCNRTFLENRKYVEVLAAVGTPWQGDFWRQEGLTEFKYLGTTLTNKNSIQEEIKSRLKVGNACYYSVQNLLSSSLLIQKVKDQDI